MDECYVCRRECEELRYRRSRHADRGSPTERCQPCYKDCRVRATCVTCGARRVLCREDKREPGEERCWRHCWADRELRSSRLRLRDFDNTDRRDLRGLCERSLARGDAVDCWVPRAGGREFVKNRCPMHGGMSVFLGGVVPLLYSVLYLCTQICGKMRGYPNA